MACPLCYAPPLAMACSALGIKQTAEIKFGAAAVGGGGMLGVAWLRRHGCAHKGMLRRANVVRPCLHTLLRPVTLWGDLPA